MIKRVIFAILLIVLILGAFFIGYYYNLNKINELQNNISQLNAQNDTNKIIKFIDDPFYCEEDSDCKMYYGCGGCEEYSINIYNEQELLKGDCSNITVACGARPFPSPTIPRCINNRCQIAEREENCLVATELCGPAMEKVYEAYGLTGSCCPGLSCENFNGSGLASRAGECTRN